MHYIMLDEIQLVENFADVLNEFLRKDNVDIYVTGSNARLLSKDVITEFRGRGHEIKMYPLSFAEYTPVNKSSLPLALAQPPGNLVRQDGDERRLIFLDCVHIFPRFQW